MKGVLIPGYKAITLKEFAKKYSALESLISTKKKKDTHRSWQEILAIE